MIWFKTYRDGKHNYNQRLSNFIIDLKCDSVDKIAPIEAGIKAVFNITKKYPPPYDLLVSGGVDSQTMIWVWLQSGIPFNVVHYSYQEENQHDTENIIKFCQTLNIDLQIYNFDAREFITNKELFDYAERYDCASPHILTYMKLVEHHENTVVMSGNYFQYGSCGINYTIFGLDRFSKIQKNNFIPFFLISTPELAYSFTNMNEEILSKIDKVGDYDYTTKCLCYEQIGIPIIPQTHKVTGFEKIKTSFDNTHVDPKLKIKYASMPSKRPFDLLYRYALFDRIGLYSDKTILLHNSF